MLRKATKNLQRSNFSTQILKPPKQSILQSEDSGHRFIGTRQQFKKTQEDKWSRNLIPLAFTLGAISLAIQMNQSKAAECEEKKKIEPNQL